MVDLPRYGYTNGERLLGEEGLGDVTVCIAAITNGAVVCASDRMLSSDAHSVEFEPRHNKTLQLTNSIASMMSGDANVQSEILQKVAGDIRERISYDPSWLVIEDVAKIYLQHYAEARLSRAERTILWPLGLDRDTYISRQLELSPGLATHIASELLRYSLPSTSIIITGIDETGPHIYTIYDGEMTCNDAIGFSAIGSGSTHAIPQMMLAAHSASNQFPETLLLVHTAKKRSEVSPGVGQSTDMLVIGPNLGTYVGLPDDWVFDLDKMYASRREKEIAAELESREEINSYVEELFRRAATEPQAVQEGIDVSGTAIEQGELPEGSGEG